MVLRFTKEFGVFTLLLSLASAASAADHSAIISGVVRDSQGVPQMGAVVQILSSSAVVKATVYTDLQGHYAVRSLLPGSYGVRATAALFLPALRSNLRLQPGHRSVVNLTLSALFDETAWLPARARGRDEPRDDWNWTLRSAAGRPILKVAEDGSLASNRDLEGRRSRPSTHVRSELTAASNRFAQANLRADLRADRLRADGSGYSAETSLAPPVAGAPSSPSSLSLSYQRPLGPGGIIGGRTSFASHPELSTGSDPAGLQILSISSAEKIDFGDLGAIEAGNRVQNITGPASLTIARPFLRVDVHPAESWFITYNLATSPDLQDFEDATASDGELPICTRIGGRLRAAGGLHQQIALTHKTRGTLLAVAYYADALDRVAVSGGRSTLGFGPDTLTSNASFTDPRTLDDTENGTFEALAPGYGSSGVHLLLTQQLGDGAWLALGYSTGAALAEVASATSGIATAMPELRPRQGQAATLSLRGSLRHTATKARVSYRWQPGILVTAVDPYDVSAGGQYLSFHLRQPLNLRRLPEGIELTIDGSNLLRQGYRLIPASAGAAPLYLAASPQSFQAGLAFSF